VLRNNNFITVFFNFSLELAIKENQDFENRNTALQEKLREKSSEKNAIALQVDELRVTLQNVETQNATLQETVEDLHREVEQLRNFVPTQSKKSFGGFSTPNVNGFSVGDISVDDPQFSPFKDSGGGGEVIGNNLILDLREDVAKLTDDLEREKELRNLEVEKSDFLAERVSELESENESQKSEIEKLTKSKTFEVDQLKVELSREKEGFNLEHEKNQIQLSALEEEKAKKEFELMQLSALSDRKTEEIDQLSSKLNKSEADLKVELEKTQILVEKVSTLEEEKVKKEVELKETSALLGRKTEEIESLSFEFDSNKLDLNFELEQNQILAEKAATLEMEKGDKEVELKQVSELSDQQTEEIKNLSFELNSNKSDLKSEIEKNQILADKMSTLEKEKAEKEVELKQISELSDKKTEEIDQLYSKLSIEKEQLKSEFENDVAELQEKLSKAESENESQKSRIDELVGFVQSKQSETEMLTSELNREKEVSNSEVEKNWALTEKISTLESQIQSQEETIKQQSDLMQSQTQHFEQVTEKLTADLKIATSAIENNEVLARKNSELKNQVKARECDAENLTELLHEKALEFDKLTGEYEKECEEIRSNLKNTFEEQFRQQREEFETELRRNEESLKSKISHLEKENVDFESKSETLYASLSEVAAELSECRKKLEELQESAKGELISKDEMSERVSQLKKEVESLSSELKSKSKEFDILKLKSIEDNEKKTEEMKQQHKQELLALEENHEKKISEMREAFVKTIDSLEAEVRQKDLEVIRLKEETESENSKLEFEKKCQEITEDCKKSKDSALAEQKSRYEARLKQVSGQIKDQYKSEIERNVAKWKADFQTKENKISELKAQLLASDSEKSELKKEVQTIEEKYNFAKQKLVEMSEDFESKENVLTHDRDQLSAKYANAKKVIVQMQEQIKKRENQMEALKMVNEQLRRELTKVKSETQIVKIASSSSSDGFKHPAAMIPMPHTPGKFLILKCH